MSIPGRHTERARAWLELDAADLAVADQSSYNSVVRKLLCFHAQQTVEKAIEALLVDNRIAFPYTHNIAVLIALLDENHVAFPDSLRESVALTEFAVLGRYPGPSESIDPAEHIAAIALARAALSWASEAVRAHDAG